MNRNNRKKRDKKRAKIERLWEEARLFAPQQAEGLQFLCPICRATYEVPDDLSGVDNAHIIPEAAGGKRTTLLCKPCNGRFGERQDRWLGDFLKYKGDGFRAFQQEKHFEVNGVRFQGRIDIKEDGTMSVIVDGKRNPPGTDTRLQQALGRPRLLFSSITGQWTLPPNVNLTVPFPVSAKTDVIFVGLLTAGYLAWFEALGYSWALQAHLDAVREQIRNADQGILPAGYVQALPKVLFQEPVIGAATIEGMTLPAFILDQWLVLFPSFEHPSAYTKLRRNMVGSEIDVQRFAFIRESEPKIRSVSHMDQVLIRPDVVKAGIDLKIWDHLVFFDGDPSPHKMEHISLEEYEAGIGEHPGEILVLAIDLRSKRSAGV